MLGNALDNMLSQYRGGSPANPPANSPTPGAPGRFFDISNQPQASPFGGRFGDVQTQSSPLGGFSGAAGSPNSFFSAASPITAGANSTGASPFGNLIPDLSKATPEQLKYITDTLSHLTYNLGAGGYIDNRANYKNTTFGPRGYYNRSVALPDQPQLDASNVFNMIGGLPTKPIGTPALNALPGYNPSPGAPLNDRLGHPYGGPWQFPNWRNNG